MAYGDFLGICQEEQLLIKYYVIKHLILLKIQNTMDINMDLLQWFGLASVVYKLFDKSSDGAVKSEIMSNQQLAE